MRTLIVMAVFLVAVIFTARALDDWMMPDPVEPDCLKVTGCKDKFRVNAPSSHELGKAALAAEFIVRKSDVDCVGRVIYESDLSTKTLRLIMQGGLRDDSDLIFPTSEGSDLSLDFDDIERRMLERCKVHAWPRVDRWPSNPDRMY